MSYDLTFALPDRPLGPSGRPDGAPDADVWRHLVDHARSILDDAMVSLTNEYGQVDDEATGIQLQVTATTARISVPYWHFEQPASIIGTLFQLAEIVEQKTGLSGVDPQVGMPVEQARQNLELVITAYTNVALMFERRARTEARIAARRAERD